MSSSAPDLDMQRARAARNESMFRAVNERIDEISATFATTAQPPAYVCECRRITCAEVMEIPRDAYERIRRDPAQFVVVPGHEEPAVEQVLERRARWLVVRKVGVGAALAAELAAD